MNTNNLNQQLTMFSQDAWELSTQLMVHLYSNPSERNTQVIGKLVALSSQLRNGKITSEVLEILQYALQCADQLPEVDPTFRSLACKNTINETEVVTTLGLTHTRGLTPTEIVVENFLESQEVMEIALWFVVDGTIHFVPAYAEDVSDSNRPLISKFTNAYAEYMDLKPASMLAQVTKQASNFNLRVKGNYSFSENN